MGLNGRILKNELMNRRLMMKNGMGRVLLITALVGKPTDLVGEMVVK